MDVTVKFEEPIKHQVRIKMLAQLPDGSIIQCDGMADTPLFTKTEKDFNQEILVNTTNGLCDALRHELRRKGL